MLAGVGDGGHEQAFGAVQVCVRVADPGKHVDGLTRGDRIGAVPLAEGGPALVAVGAERDGAVADDGGQSADRPAVGSLAQ